MTTPGRAKGAAKAKSAPAKAKKTLAKAKSAPAKANATANPRRRTRSSRRAVSYLSANDPVLAEVIAAAGPLPDSREGRPDRGDHYGALVRTIVGQQLSVYAARAIYGRLSERFSGRPPTPAEILADDPDELRAAAGLSHANVHYLRSLAEHVISGELQLDRLDELGEEVIAELVAVKGLGRGSADMFLMFHLERPTAAGRRPRHRSSDPARL